MSSYGDMIAVDRAELGVWSKLRQSLSAHAIHFIVPLALFFFVKLSRLWNPAVVESNPLEVILGIVFVSIPFGIFGLLMIQFYHVAFTDKSKSPGKDLWRRTSTVLRNPKHMVPGLPLYFALVLFMYSFTTVKVNVSNFTPFSWDVAFDAMDRSLHFGYRPWELLQPIFGNVVGTLFLNVNYNLWFMIMQMFWVSFAFLHAPGVKRTHFYLAFMVTWAVGGSALAILFSSAGPCFFGNVVAGENPYAPLMAQLNYFNTIIPVWAVDTQVWLWQLHAENSAVAGVSAMPSMHNATALLFVLATWNGRKLWRNLMIAHAVLIFLGSIHLGWHYAVDSYFAWPIAILVWFATKPVAVWWENRAHVEAFRLEYANV